MICGHYEGTEFLLKQGANPNITNSLGETPLHQASDNTQYKLAKLLLDYQANPNAQQNDGDTPLHHASFRGDGKMLEMLLAHDGNPNIPNFLVVFIQFGRTPLHYAVDSGNCECIKLLINQGANPNILDKQGKSCFDINNNEDVQTALKTTPFVEENSEVVGSSFNFNCSEGIISPNATNFISDIEDQPMFDTFGIDKIHKVLKNSHQLKPIFNWLKEIELEELYEKMCDAGYDDTKSMISQMLGPLPITDSDLKNSGISKPGHRLRILLKLEQDAGILPKLKLKKSVENPGLMHCCMIANNATRNLASNSLIE